MWFRNLQVFRLKEPFRYGQDELERALEGDRFRACGSLEASVQGWHPPLAGEEAPLCFAANGCFLVCLRREEKLLPASVVNDLLAERVEQIESEEGRSVQRRERQRLRDEVYYDLLPRAFTRSSLAFAYLDAAQGWVVADAATPKRGEDLVSQLRRSLGSLPAAPLRVKQPPAEVLTRWLQGRDLPRDFALADQCELRDPDEAGGIVRCRRQDLTADEIQAHLKAGKRAVELAVEWDGRLGLVITEQPALKRVRPADLLLEEAADAAGEDPWARLDAELTLMSAELRRLLDRLVEVFGGLDPE
jgi:recombination associated protein RdgC